MSISAPSSLDDVLHLVVTHSASNIGPLSSVLRHWIRKDKDAAEIILSSQLGSGQDPLTVLALPAHTIGLLYILSARLLSSSPIPVPFTFIQNFCRTFNPDQARYSPERVTLLAQGIVKAADQAGSLKLALAPLRTLLQRYPPTLRYLTTIHPIFLHACAATQHYSYALPILQHPISEIDKSLCDLTYHTALNYHYIGGFCLTALKRFKEAEEFFEIVVATPSSGLPAALQLEALLKLSLVQLILYGKVQPPPKHTHPILLRLYKSSPYAALAKAYPGTTAQLQSFVEKEGKLISADENVGLVKQVIERAPRWVIRKLTETYVTLSLAEIGKAVGSESEAEIRALVLSMIERGEICASLSASGTVTFRDPPVEFSRADVDRMLFEMQEHSRLLADFDRELELSKEFLQKAIKDKEHGGPAWTQEEMEFFSGGGPRGAEWDDGEL